DGLLDVARRVLEDGHVRAEGRAQRCRPRLSELQRAVRVAMDEDALDRDLRGRVFVTDAPDLLEDASKPIVMRPARSNASPFDRAGRRSHRIDDTETGDLRSRIDAEDADAAAHGAAARAARLDTSRAVTRSPPGAPRGYPHCCTRSARRRARRARRAASRTTRPAGLRRAPSSRPAS